MQGLVVDTSLVEGESGIVDLCVCKLFWNTGLNIAIDVGAEVVREAIGFVNEDLDVETRFVLVYGEDVGVK